MIVSRKVKIFSVFAAVLNADETKWSSRIISLSGPKETDDERIT